MSLAEAAQLLLIGWGVMAGMMLVLWAVQRWIRDAGIVDVGWAFGLGILAVLYAVFGAGWPARRVLVAVLAGVWSMRLGLYLLFNRVLSGPEDGRYQTLREQHAGHLQRFFVIFFQAQGLLDVILSVPFLVALSHPAGHWRAWDVAGVSLWLISVSGEALADRQLARFRADERNPRNNLPGRVVALLRDTPNYFFQSLFWWSFVLISVGAPAWWCTLISPLLILFFILKVTGIPPTEAQAVASRGDDYRAYQRTTSAFVPWFPKRETPCVPND